MTPKASAQKSYTTSAHVLLALWPSPQPVGGLRLYSPWGSIASHRAVMQGNNISIPVHKHKGERALGCVGSCKLPISPRILNARCATKAFGVALERLMDFIWMSFSKRLWLRYCYVRDPGRIQAFRLMRFHLHTERNTAKINCASRYRALERDEFLCKHLDCSCLSPS